MYTVTAKPTQYQVIPVLTREQMIVAFDYLVNMGVNTTLHGGMQRINDYMSFIDPVSGDKQLVDIGEIIVYTVDPDGDVMDLAEVITWDEFSDKYDADVLNFHVTNK
jgi:hypothetical protein